MIDKAREKINQIFDSCYSRDLSACSRHTIFQRQKAHNEILQLLEGYHKLPDKESIRIKAIQMFWGDVSVPDFVEWLYGDKNEDIKRKPTKETS